MIKNSFILYKLLYLVLPFIRTAKGYSRRWLIIFDISLKLFIWKFPKKLIIGSSLHRNNRAVMLITKLNEVFILPREGLISSDSPSIDSFPIEIALPCLDPISIGTFRVDPFLLRLVFTPILGVTLRIA
ncbi:hypothetical protein ACJX0J_006078 [Zea mays]